MMVMEALKWANETLKKGVDGSGLDSPMLDAEVLLAAALDVNKAWLFTHLDRELKAHENDAFRAFVKRRATGEPVAYVIGYREFYKRRFAVNRHVLIPRPATEVLVEAALSAATEDHPQPLLDGRRGDERNDSIFCDIGTGSGAIAVTLAAESKLHVLATDMSKEALAVARSNAVEHKVDELVDFRHGNLVEPVVKIFASLGNQSPYRHLIVCANLPYLTQHQVDAAQREVRDFEPHEALIAGQDGLDDYWNLIRLLKKSRAVLPERVTILLEIDPSQNARIVELIRHDFPHAEPTIAKDLEGFDRVVTAEV